MVPVLEELFNAMMRPDWSEDKRNLHSHKCRVEGAHGTPIICRRASCTGCPNAGKDMKTNQTSSIEDLKNNSNWESAKEDITSTKAMGHNTIYSDRKRIKKLESEFFKED